MSLRVMAMSAPYTMPRTPSATMSGGDAVRLGREDGEGEPQNAVEAGLAGEDHDGGGGGFHDGILQPAVQREHRNLDGECNHER